MFSCDFTFGIENYFSFSFRFGSSAVAKQEIKLVETSLDGLKTVNSLNTDLVVAQDQCHSAISELKNQTQVLPSQMNSNDGLKSSLDVSKPGTLSQNQCPLFYAIPSEIKSMVYRELLVTDEPVKDAHERLDSKVTIFLKDFQPISSIDARILRTYNDEIGAGGNANTLWSKRFSFLGS
ncbi:hypothetical protein MMC12_007545 [Toensbergia leucococca]|nr:hypothetical protein [Toensbergia leucococca]